MKKEDFQYIRSSLKMNSSSWRWPSQPLMDWNTSFFCWCSLGVSKIFWVFVSLTKGVNFRCYFPCHSSFLVNSSIGDLCTTLFAGCTLFLLRSTSNFNDVNFFSDLARSGRRFELVFLISWITLSMGTYIFLEDLDLSFQVINILCRSSASFSSGSRTFEPFVNFSYFFSPSHFEELALVICWAEMLSRLARVLGRDLILKLTGDDDLGVNLNSERVNLKGLKSYVGRLLASREKKVIIQYIYCFRRVDYFNLFCMLKYLLIKISLPNKERTITIEPDSCDVGGRGSLHELSV